MLRGLTPVVHKKEAGLSADRVPVWQPQTPVCVKDVLNKTMKPFHVTEGVPGFFFAGVSTGIKKGKKDLGLILSSKPCTAAGVFTKNRVKAAPVLLCKKRLQKGFAQAILVNSGNANACTGRKGMDDALKTCSGVSSYLDISENLVLPCSTGVIGVDFPLGKILKAVPKLVKEASTDRINDFAESILTTDTHPKIITLKGVVNGETVKIAGIAKGSGMIMPNMATMLAFIVTDAAIEKTLLSQLLKDQVDETFNTITVDGDMSTNDTVLVLANGQSEKTVSSRKSGGFRVFEKMLYEVMKKLSLMIVRDGEGATKLISVSILNARTRGDAKKAALQVANSTLVKTAFFGEDFNWGRIMAALGSSGASLDMDKISIFFNGIQAVRNGQGVKENITRLKKTVKNRSVSLAIDLNHGNKCHEITTCDLSYEYVKINAEYTT